MQGSKFKICIISLQPLDTEHPIAQFLVGQQASDSGKLMIPIKSEENLLENSFLFRQARYFLSFSAL